MLDLIFAAVIAVFVVYRLILVLGKEEYKKPDIIESIRISILKEKAKQAQDADFEVIPPEEASLPDNIRAVFEILRKEDKNFNAKTFIAGTKKAFEMIIDALNNYYQDVLKELLEYNFYRHFVSELRKRHDSGLKYEITLVSIKNVEILEACIEDEIASIKIASIKVKIDSEQIILTKDKKGEITAGKVDEILQISNVWTFSKNIRSESYWKLTETSSK